MNFVYSFFFKKNSDFPNFTCNYLCMFSFMQFNNVQVHVSITTVRILNSSVNCKDPSWPLKKKNSRMRYKWNYTVYNLFRLTFFTQYNFLVIHPICYMYQQFILFFTLLVSFLWYRCTKFVTIVFAFCPVTLAKLKWLHKMNDFHLFLCSRVEHKVIWDWVMHSLIHFPNYSVSPLNFLYLPSQITHFF